MMLYLLLGDLDRARCEAGCLLDTRRAVVYLDDEADIVLAYCGDQVELGDLQQRITANGLPAALFVEDLNAMRQRVYSLTYERIHTIVPHLNTSTMSSFLADNWRRLTASTLAALAIGTSGFIPGLSLRSNVPDDEFDEHELLGTFQTFLWITLLVDWSRSVAPGQFEDDLVNYVDDTIIVLNAIPRFEKAAAIRIRGMDIQETPDDRLRLLALLASLYAQQGTAEPGFSDRWALTWLANEVNRRLAGLPPDPATTVSHQRIRKTIQPDNVTAAAAHLLNSITDPGQFVMVYDLVAAVLREQGFQPPDDFSLASPLDQLTGDILGMIEDVELNLGLADQPHREALRDVAMQLARPLVEARRVREVLQIAAKLRARYTDRADGFEIDQWLARALLIMGLPDRALSVVGATPDDDESQLAIGIRARLTEVRVLALRELTRNAEAHRAMASLPADAFVHPECGASLTVAKAIVLRNLGRPLEAITVLEQLLEQIDEPYPPLYEALAVTYRWIGKIHEASEHARRAWVAATSSQFPGWPVDRLAAITLHFEAIAGKPLDHGLADSLRRANLGNDPKTTLTLLQTLLIHAQHGTLETRWQHWIETIAIELGAFTRRAIRSRNMRMATLAFIGLSRYHELYSPHLAFAAWSRFEHLMRKRFGWQAGEAVLPLAKQYADMGQLEPARRLMRRYFATSGFFDRQATFADGALMGIEDNRDKLSLASALLSRPDSTPADFRLVADLSRGAVARHWQVQRSSRRRPPQWTREGLSDRVVRALAPQRGQLAVLDWIGSPERSHPYLTVIDASGAVTSARLHGTPGDLTRTARRLNYRLSTWIPGGDDPLSDEAWQRCAAWARDYVCGEFGEDDHVVVLPHPGNQTTPWHIAMLPFCGCSYSPSWVALLDDTTRRGTRPQASEMVAAVPRFKESETVTNAFSAFIAEVSNDPDRTKHIRILQGAECDRSALRDALGAADIGTLLLHGYSDLGAGEVSLMLAAGGRLPLAHSVAANSATSLVHRLGWNDYAAFSQVPSLLFSAACSSGSSYATLSGERVGLFNVLRGAGLRSLVAPQWDINASEVLPIVANVRRRVLGGETPGRAVRSAISNALATGVPAPSAYALSLEGDWK